jgi:hypothetical protein
MSETLMVPMDVTYENAWISWVGSATTCLKALGVYCDTIDVAGQSGYAFMLCVHEALCPSGPTMLDWGGLETGVHMLGRTTMAFRTDECHIPQSATQQSREHCRKAYEYVESEVRAGRPCVIWGAYVPEFAVAVGVSDGQFILKSCFGACGRPEPPLPYEELNAPGGPYVLAFPSTTSWADWRQRADKHAIGRAAQLLHTQALYREYAFGISAYDRWIEALLADKAAPFGNSYNAQCYAEGRAFARDYLGRVAGRQPGVGALRDAQQQYVQAAAAMAEMAKLFPMPYSRESIPQSDRLAAADLLKQARDAETRALAALDQAVQAKWTLEVLAAG